MNTNKSKAWTAEENELLLETVRTSSTRKVAFIAVAGKLDRTVKSVSGHYYVLTSLDHSAWRWSPKEDKIILKCIASNPTNLQKAFRKASTKINRSTASCQLRWYSYLKNTTEGQESVVIMSRNKIFTGGKNSKRSGNRLLVKTWNKIKSFIGM